MDRIPTIDDYLKTPDNPLRQVGGCRLATKRESIPEQPLVTVFTIVRNRKETLPQTIISVLSQSYPNIEYIVVDGASTDGTLEVIKQFDDKIDFWISEPDHGPSDATNKAISLARGDIVCWLSSDDWIDPDHIEVAVKTILSSDADFVFGRVTLYKHGVLNFTLEGDKNFTKSIISRKTNLNFPCWVIKRKCFDKVGLLDLRYKICCDYEWALRLHLLGGRGVYESRLNVHFGGGGTSDTYIFQMVLEELKALRQHGLPITRAVVAILYSFMRRMVGNIAKLFLPHNVYQKLMRVVRRKYSVPSATSIEACVTTADVLRSRSQIDQSRQELRRRNLSCLSTWPKRVLRKLGLAKGVSVGDYIKSWDVLKTATFIERNVPRHASVLDIGAFASEIPCVLHRLGYSSLTAVDLNPMLERMPDAGSIRYVVSDFTSTPFEEKSFEAITAISVIEHGFRSQSLLKEVARLLCDGGYFVASFDYWKDKIDTSGISLFGLDWIIFSEAELLAFIEEACDYGLMPVGEVNLNVENPAIEWGGKKYTFGWLVLQKRAG